MENLRLQEQFIDYNFYVYSINVDIAKQRKYVNVSIGIRIGIELNDCRRIK